MSKNLTKHQKNWSFEQAIKITKEAARGGSKEHPETILRDVYEELLKIQSEVSNTPD